MRIFLGAFEAFVAKEAADLFELHPRLQKVRGYGVAQDVHAEGFLFERFVICLVFEQLQTHVNTEYRPS